MKINMTQRVCSDTKSNKVCCVESTGGYSHNLGNLLNPTYTTKYIVTMAT